MNPQDGKAAAESEPLLVAVHPGAGVIDRDGDVLLVLPVVRPGQWGQVQRLLELLHREIPRRIEASSARERQQALVSKLEQADVEGLAGLALLQGLDAELVLLAYGEVEITVDGPERQRLRGGDSWPCQSHRVPGPVSLLRVLATTVSGSAVSGSVVSGSAVPGSAVSGSAVSGSAVPGSAVPGSAVSGSAVSGLEPFDLRAGTVPGSGVTLRRGRLSPSGPAEAPQATVARKAVTFASVLISGLAEQPQARRPPLPIDDDSADQPAPGPGQDEVLVDAAQCPAGHVNDPESERCASCGVTLGGWSGQLVRRPRPALGVLVTDAGSVFALTGDYVIGRAPERDEAVLSGRAKPLVLRDVGQSVSRVHAQLQLTGWRVLVTDRGSANGTFLSRAGRAGTWQRLPAGTPMPLLPGDRLRIGARQLLFESYREEVAGRGGWS